MERNYQYSDNDNLVSIAEIEKALLEYFRTEEISDSGCSYNGRWFSLQTVMDAITRDF